MLDSLVGTVFFNATATTVTYTYCHTLSLHDALPKLRPRWRRQRRHGGRRRAAPFGRDVLAVDPAGAAGGARDVRAVSGEPLPREQATAIARDRKSTRLNSSH